MIVTGSEVSKGAHAVPDVVKFVLLCHLPMTVTVKMMVLVCTCIMWASMAGISCSAISSQEKSQKVARSGLGGR